MQGREKNTKYGNFLPPTNRLLSFGAMMEEIQPVFFEKIEFELGKNQDEAFPTLEKTWGVVPGKIFS